MSFLMWLCLMKICINETSIERRAAQPQEALRIMWWTWHPRKHMGHSWIFSKPWPPLIYFIQKMRHMPLFLNIQKEWQRRLEWWMHKIILIIVYFMFQSYKIDQEWGLDPWPVILTLKPCICSLTLVPPSIPDHDHTTCSLLWFCYSLWHSNVEHISNVKGHHMTHIIE